jgi:serine/threonine protein kinase
METLQRIVLGEFNNKLALNNHIGNEHNSMVYQGIYNNNKKNLTVIVKFISVKDTPNFNQLLLEIGFIKYLSKFVSSKKYISICYNVKLTNDYLIIVQELPIGISLKQFISHVMGLSYDEYCRLICVLMYKLLIAINYIHVKGVAHRGLNPENIYVNYVNGQILDVKITDFAVSCGKYIGISYDSSKPNNHSNSHLDDYFCQTLDFLINPPEKFNISELVGRIKRLSKDQTRNGIYLYLAKKADIWALGILFWKLLNKQNNDNNPLDMQFPINYQLEQSWKQFRGHPEASKLIKKIFESVIERMLSEIPKRAKSSDILENFVLVNKYYEDWDTDLRDVATS